MKLVVIKCPNCHADVEVNKELEEAVCNYCGNKFLIEDNRKHTAMKTICNDKCGIMECSNPFFYRWNNTVFYRRVFLHIKWINNT